MGSERQNQKQWRRQNTSGGNDSTGRMLWQHKSYEVGGPFASKAEPPSSGSGLEGLAAECERLVNGK